MNHAPSVRQQIEAAFSKLSGQQRRAAEFLLAHHLTAFSLSVQELAREAAVSEATLVRFSRTLGFKGYLELRGALTEEAKRGLLPEDRFAFEEPSRAPMGTAAKVAQREVENVNRTLDAIDPRQLRRFVEKLRGAEVAATMGLGVSAILARLAAYQLFQVGLRSELLLRDTVTLIEQVERLPKRAVLLTFSLPPYSKDTAHAAARAAERRIPVLLITDGPQSPLCTCAHAALFVRTENILYTNSITGVAMLINTLVTELALANKPRALDQLQAASRAVEGEYL